MNFFLSLVLIVSCAAVWPVHVANGQLSCTDDPAYLPQSQIFAHGPWIDSEAPHAHGSVAEYECIFGHASLSGNTFTTSVCDDGTWTPVAACKPEWQRVAGENVYEYLLVNKNDKPISANGRCKRKHGGFLATTASEGVRNLARDLGDAINKSLTTGLYGTTPPGFVFEEDPFKFRDLDAAAPNLSPADFFDGNMPLQPNNPYVQCGLLHVSYDPSFGTFEMANGLDLSLRHHYVCSRPDDGYIDELDIQLLSGNYDQFGVWIRGLYDNRLYMVSTEPSYCDNGQCDPLDLDNNLVTVANSSDYDVLDFLFYAVPPAYGKIWTGLFKGDQTPQPPQLTLRWRDGSSIENLSHELFTTGLVPSGDGFLAGTSYSSQVNNVTGLLDFPPASQNPYLCQREI